MVYAGWSQATRGSCGPWFPSWNLWWHADVSPFSMASHVWTHLATSQPIYISHFNFFLQGFLKKKLFMRKCTTLVECKALIIELCCTVADNMCQRWSHVHIYLDEVMWLYWWSHETYYSLVTIFLIAVWHWVCDVWRFVLHPLWLSCLVWKHEQFSFEYLCLPL